MNENLISQAKFAEIVKVSPADITRAKNRGVFPDECFEFVGDTKRMNKKKALAFWIKHTSIHGNASQESRNAAMLELKKIKTVIDFDEDDDDDLVPESPPIDLDDARIEEISTRIQLNKIKIARQKAILIERSVIAHILSSTHSAIRSRFQSLPSRVTSFMRGCTTDHEAELYLSREIEMLCHDISKIDLQINEEIKSFEE